jgi:hypothetical protein
LLPNVCRFCGQTFAERPDKDLALLCVRAYNDWMMDEWCGGSGAGRLIPLTLVPLWDPDLTAALSDWLLSGILPASPNCGSR